MCTVDDARETKEAKRAGGPPRRGYRALAIVTPLWAAVLCLVSAYSIHGSMGDENAVRLPFESEVHPVLYLPQGWKFFTRDAREERLSMWKKTDGGAWVRADLGPNGSAANWHGLSRRGRVESIEVGLLSTSIPKSVLVPCDDEPGRCFDAQPATLRIKNEATTRRYCGTFGVAWTPPVPWAWSSLPEKPVMPSKTVVVELTC